MFKFILFFIFHWHVLCPYIVRNVCDFSLVRNLYINIDSVNLCFALNNNGQDLTLKAEKIEKHFFTDDLEPLSIYKPMFVPLKETVLDEESSKHFNKYESTQAYDSQSSLSSMESLNRQAVASLDEENFICSAQEQCLDMADSHENHLFFSQANLYFIDGSLYINLI